MLKRLYSYVPYIVISVITILYLLLALLRHYHFMTYGYDLGIYDQQVWLYSRFHNPFLTIEYKSALLNHFSPSLALLSPLYWIYSDPKALLIAQALMIGVSAIPLDILAKRKQLPIYLRSMLSISYLTFFAYQYSVNYDVHSLVLGVTLIPFLIITLEDRRYKLAAILLLIILGMKESFPITIASIGLLYVFKGRKKLGISLMLSSAAFLIVALKIIQPLIMHFTNETYRFSASNTFNPVDLFTRLFDTAQKREAWTLSFLWYALIPLAAPIMLIPAVADNAFYFIFGNNHPETLTIYNHYRSALAPLLAWGAIEACANIHSLIIKKVNRPHSSALNKSVYIVLTLLLLASWIYHQKVYNLPLNALSNPSWYTTPQYVKDNYQIIKKVSPNVSIAAQNNLAPHLSQRKDIHLIWPVERNQGYVKFPICRQELNKIILGQENSVSNNDTNCPSQNQIASPCNNDYCFLLRFHEKDTYLVTDSHQGQNATQLLMENEEKLKEGLKSLEKTGFISLQDQAGEAKLWKVSKLSR